MKIKSLEISGFKSFCDRTRVLFDNAVTAVVGPNGCGKSNIVDAIRWALGEQSAKNLRGKGMGDVIFNGSEKRGPQSMAEVTITFDNSDGLSHPLYADYPEIAITRKLHRDGSSDYLINKTPCRLKDVTDLFMGTGGGARAYSIIEQGRIGLIVSSRTEDRRAMIEEAAGITRFKKARQAAQRKMEQTRLNLMRIKDVVAEMARTQESLRKQARKAQRYNLLADEQRDAQLHLASHRYLELLTVQKTAKALLNFAKDEYETAKNELDALEARFESLRMEEAQARNELEKVREKNISANNEITLLETEIRHLENNLQRIKTEETALVEERQESSNRINSNKDEQNVLDIRLEALKKDAQAMNEINLSAQQRAEEARERLAQTGKEYDEKRDNLSRCKARTAAAQSAFDSLHHRIEDLESRTDITRSERRSLEEHILGLKTLVENFETQHLSIEKKLEDLKNNSRIQGQNYENLREQVQLCDEEKNRVRNDLLAKSSRLSSLLELSQSMERHDNGVKQAVKTLKDENGPFFDGMLIDYLQCESKYEQALAAVLTDKLSALVTTNYENGFSLVKWLKEKELGRVSTISLEPYYQETNYNDSISLQGIIGPLSDFIKIDAKIKNSVLNLLKDTYLVENEEVANTLKQKSPENTSFVTLDGQYIDSKGVISGGRSNSPATDLLAQQRQIRQLEKEVSALETQFQELETRLEYLKDEMKRVAEAAEEARLEASKTEFKLNEIDKDRTRAKDDLENATNRGGTLEKELEQQSAQLTQLNNDRDRLGTEIQKSTTQIASLQQSIEEQSSLIAAYRDELDRLASRATEAKINEAKVRQQYESALERSTQIASLEDELTVQLQRLHKKTINLAEDKGKTAGRLFLTKEKLSYYLDNVQAIQDLVKKCSVVLDEKSNILIEATQLSKNKRSLVEEKAQIVTDLQISLQQALSDISNLVENTREKHDVVLPKILGDYHLREIPGKQVKDRIEEIKIIINRMGPINPGAIEEFQEIQARFEEKAAQKEDIEQALEDLETAISRMDKDSRRMFKEAFDAINQDFQKIFPRLFKGGHACLKLTDPNDMLTTGVDIEASPPGKKLGAIELMSGGEKALTAVSLLFAIFLQKPSPFCLLDEVDAPLDDANIGRFIDMVHELTDRSQFVIITHSKITMEGADTLYGVTMQEPGVSKMISVNLVHHDEPKVANG